jgi:glycosyltransferase involved in cell wall biosynthesis
VTRVLGLDWSAAARHAPGVGRFGRELVRACVRGAVPDLDLALIEFGRGPRLAEEFLGLTGPDVVRPPRRHRRWPVPKRVAAPFVRALGADAWVGGCDLFLRAQPRWPHSARAPTAWALAQWPLDAAEEAVLAGDLAANTRILVFAHAAAERLVEWYGVARERVHVLPVGCDHWLRGAEPRAAAAAPRTVLVLGALEPRRTPGAVLEAFERLHARGLVERLLFVGRRGAAAEDFARLLCFSSARRDVQWIHEPVERDLPALVAGAAALVHVGEGEATAVTPLEALVFGVPVVVSDTPVMREVLGSVAEYPAPSSERRRGAAIAEALERALATSDDPAARAARRAHAASSTWAACARALAAVV